MAVIFKIADGATPETVRAILDRLAAAGLPAAPLYPGASRPALTRVHVVRAAAATVDRVEAALAPHRRSIDYVEPSPDRRPA
ncbi:MAG: hypothetical protein AB7O45_11740 [Alphaproteobacteria bacterium]